MAERGNEGSPNEEPGEYKVKGFESLKPAVAEKLKGKLIAGDRKCSKEAREASYEDPEYTEAELLEIVESFTKFNNAVKRGLPNELYRMMTRLLAPDLAERAHASAAIWDAHEDAEEAKVQAQRFADAVKAEIDKRKDWDVEQFYRERFLSGDS